MLTMKIHFNTKHLIEQAAQRVLTSDGNPFQLSERQLNALKATILDNAPADWRFTEKPEGDFMVTVIGGNAQVKFVGRSYRESDDSAALFSDFLTCVGSFRHAGELNPKTVRWLAQRYLKCLADPGAEICHEFKTIIESDKILSTEFEDEHDRYPHLMLQDRARVTHNLKKRPNALIMRGADDQLELWVRQGHPFFAVKAARANIGSYCLFARLSPEGVTGSHGAVWEFDRWGTARLIGSAVCGTPFRLGSDLQLPCGMRSKNYWELPTHLDAKHMDAEFMARKSLREDTEPDSIVRARLVVMAAVYDRAKELNQSWIVKAYEARLQRQESRQAQSEILDRRSPGIFEVHGEECYEAGVA
jgi:hypothetical protein